MESAVRPRSTGTQRCASQSPAPLRPGSASPAIEWPILIRKASASPNLWPTRFSSRYRTTQNSPTNRRHHANRSAAFSIGSNRSAAGTSGDKSFPGNSLICGASASGCQGSDSNNRVNSAAASRSRLFSNFRPWRSRKDQHRSYKRWKQADSENDSKPWGFRRRRSGSIKYLSGTQAVRSIIFSCSSVGMLRIYPNCGATLGKQLQRFATS